MKITITWCTNCESLSRVILPCEYDDDPAYGEYAERYVDQLRARRDVIPAKHTDNWIFTDWNGGRFSRPLDTDSPTECRRRVDGPAILAIQADEDDTISPPLLAYLADLIAHDCDRVARDASGAAEKTAIEYIEQRKTANE